MSKAQAQTSSSTRYNDIVCIGAGISGICLGAQLKRKWNFTDIHLYDRNESFGGTWLKNIYPGIACDVPTILYSFSFDRNDDTSNIFAPGSKIQAYLSTVVDKYQLRSRMTFSTKWLSATWDESRQLWMVQLQDLKTGETYIHECRILYSAIGLLSTARMPDIPGASSFKGLMAHTFDWPEADVDVTDKNVIIIGNGCTATQIIPTILSSSKSITQIFRTPQYYFPVEIRPYKGFLKWGMENIPGFSLIVRMGLYWILEEFGRGFRKDKKGNKIRAKGTERCMQFMKETAPEKYHSMLTPDYPLGAKRRICDDMKAGYLRALHSEKVQVTKTPVSEITPEGVRTADNKIHPADIIIVATGFDTSILNFDNIPIVGRGGEILSQYWKRETEVATAYNTACVPGFPNFFLLFGPGSSSGHTSIILPIENIINYSMKLIKPIVISKNALAIEVKPEAARAYYHELERANENLVVGSCDSIYMVNGKNIGVYPWSQYHFWRRTAFPKWKHFSYVYTSQYSKSIHLGQTLKMCLYVVVALVLLLTTLANVPVKSSPWREHTSLSRAWDRITACIYDL